MWFTTEQIFAAGSEPPGLAQRGVLVPWRCRAGGERTGSGDREQRSTLT